MLSCYYLDLDLVRNTQLVYMYSCDAPKRKRMIPALDFMIASK